MPIICRECDEEIVDGVIAAKDVAALNKKLLGRDRDSFFCVDCMAEFFECTVDDLAGKVEEFRQQGCTLFG